MLVAAAQLAACKGRDDLDGHRRKPPGLAERGAEFDMNIGDGRVVYDFYDNRASAVVVAGRVLEIGGGGVELAKFIDGGYRTPWRVGAVDDGYPVVLVPGLAGELYLPVDSDKGGVARGADGSLPIYLEIKPAVPKQLVSVFLNEHKLGDVSMTNVAWGRYRVTAPASIVREGENKLRFYFRHTGEIDGVRSAAMIRAIRVGGPGVTAQALRSGVVSREDERLAALELGRAARTSYYLRLPESPAALVMAVAAEPGVRLAVTVVSGDTGDHSVELWSGVGAAGWHRVSIDLAEYAGDVVRLDFVNAGAVAWGRPQLVVKQKLGAAARHAEAMPKKARVADHVIVWTVASLRAEAMQRIATPSFDRLTAKSLHAVQVTAPSPRTGPAQVALMTGRWPEGARLIATGVNLASRFRDAGYATALFSGNGFITDDAGFSRGFDVYRNPMRLRQPSGARFLWQKARRFLADHADGTTLIYVAAAEPHLPYTPTAGSVEGSWLGMAFKPAETAAVSAAMRAGKRRLSREEKDYVRALYDAEVRDTDAAIGQMLSDLDNMGLRDRTAIIVVGDSGEELFERGAFGPGELLYSESLHVPLAVSRPGQMLRRVLKTSASTVDVYPTALELAGISPGAQIQGRSLLGSAVSSASSNTAAEDSVVPIFLNLPGRARGVIVGRHKLVITARGEHLLFDLVADPHERTNLMGKRPLVERFLRGVFGLGVRFRSAWSRQRWGNAANVKAAFAADHGL